LADALGLSAEQAAQGVIDVADVAMEGALRVISVERGHDPAAFTLVPFGGAAGLHAAELAGRLGIERILLPPDPGVLSAFGMLVAPIRKEASRTVLLEAAAGSTDDVARQLNEAFAALEAEVLAALADEGLRRRRPALERVVDARYAGQSHELRVPADDWVERFHAAHERRYGYAARAEPVVAVTLRVVGAVEVDAPPSSALPEASGRAPVEARCDVVVRGTRLPAARYRRDTLLAGHSVAGPAIVTEYSATAWLPPGWHGLVLGSGSILIRRT
ncbi:MAG: hydantoinase/oxoprolinase family protein, partial [Longimicrobiales bacterium]